MDINKYFASRFLKAADLGGAAPVVTIERVEEELLGGGQGHPKEIKAVVYFRGKEKGLVLNKVNAQTIARIAGSSNTDDWLGVRVQLYVTQVEFGGDLVDTIRVRAPQQSTAAAKVPPRPVESEPEAGASGDDAIPF